MRKVRTPKETALEWAAAYNARDPHALVQLYHDDAENHQVAFGEPMHGREALLESFVSFFRAFPDNFTHPINILEDGEWVTVEWKGAEHFLGRWANMRPMARVSRCRVAAFFM